MFVGASSEMKEQKKEWNIIALVKDYEVFTTSKSNNIDNELFWRSFLMQLFNVSALLLLKNNRSAS